MAPTWYVSFGPQASMSRSGARAVGHDHRLQAPEFSAATGQIAEGLIIFHALHQDPSRGAEVLIADRPRKR